MRVLVVLCALLFGCTYETNYYGVISANDGGVIDMSGYYDHEGNWIEESGPSIFRAGSKLQGNALLTLQEAGVQVPMGGGALPTWPRTALDVPWQRAAAQTIIDVSTKDGEPHVVTITLGDQVGVPPQGEALNSPTEVVAILDLGIGGVSMLAEIDYVRGVQFSLAVTRLQLHVVYRVINGGNLITTMPPPYRVAAALSSGTIAHGRQPQRTLARHGLAAGADEGWYVPMFAKSFRMTAVPNNTQIDVEMLDSAFGAANALYQAVAYPTVDWPVGSEMQTIRAVNRSAFNTDHDMIFDLAL